MDILQKILQAREERDLLRKQFSEANLISISFNLNVPGVPKLNPLYNQFFYQTKEKLKNWLTANRVFILPQSEFILNHAAGDFFIAAIKPSQLKSSEIKKITEQFEQNHALGRFIDVDITDKTGQQISSGKHKICFFCQNFPAIDCMRQNRHSKDELRAYQQDEILKYIKLERFDKLAHKVTSNAIRSILYEISLSPKPGLVSCTDNGIHQDMDYRLFLDSTSLISTYFERIFRKGTQCEPENLSNALPIIRSIGLEMEQAMFAHTQGINTQKGLIFLMGISLFATGFILKDVDIFDKNQFVETIKHINKNLVEAEFAIEKEATTHGEHCFQKYKKGGIRYEAEHGFPTVFSQALPILIAENNTEKEALAKTLISIITVLDDTNILYRSNPQTLELLQTKCKLALVDFTLDCYSEIISFCNHHKISPGGAADLLSITVFMYLMEDKSI